MYKLTALNASIDSALYRIEKNFKHSPYKGRLKVASAFTKFFNSVEYKLFNVCINSKRDIPYSASQGLLLHIKLLERRLKKVASQHRPRHTGLKRLIHQGSCYLEAMGFGVPILYPEIKVYDDLCLLHASIKRCRKRVSFFNKQSEAFKSIRSITKLADELIETNSMRYECTQSEKLKTFDLNKKIIATKILEKCVVFSMTPSKLLRRLRNAINSDLDKVFDEYLDMSLEQMYEKNIDPFYDLDACIAKPLRQYAKTYDPDNPHFYEDIIQLTLKSSPSVAYWRRLNLEKIYMAFKPVKFNVKPQEQRAIEVKEPGSSTAAIFRRLINFVTRRRQHILNKQPAATT